ncbi:MAG: hypothetical protein ACXW34_11750, partial [Nitrospira sp.]
CALLALKKARSRGLFSYDMGRSADVFAVLQLSVGGVVRPALRAFDKRFCTCPASACNNTVSQFPQR